MIGNIRIQLTFSVSRPGGALRDRHFARKAYEI